MAASALHAPTLVLNRNWQPVNVATVARALIMLWNATARVVDPVDYQLYEWEDWTRLQPKADEPFVQAVSQRIRVPEVISLAVYDRLPTATVAFSRRNVFKRDHYTCQYCGCQPKPEELTIENGFLTPTMKVKRRVVGEQLADTIAALYVEEAADETGGRA